MIDIIIPVLNEEAILREKASYYLWLSTQGRVVFVDGGSKDRTVELAQKYGEVLAGPRGRGYQKNFGAQHSQADVLLFLHVDSYVSEKNFEQIDLALINGVQVGCFKLNIEAQGVMFRIYEKVVNVRAKYFGVADGDLGLFIKRSFFEAIGQFDDLEILEDLFIGRKIRKVSKINFMPVSIEVSARKWEEHGFLKMFFFYTCAYIQYWTGLPVLKMAKC